MSPNSTTSAGATDQSKGLRQSGRVRTAPMRFDPAQYENPQEQESKIVTLKLISYPSGHSSALPAASISSGDTSALSEIAKGKKRANSEEPGPKESTVSDVLSPPNSLSEPQVKRQKVAPKPRSLRKARGKTAEVEPSKLKNRAAPLTEVFKPVPEPKATPGEKAAKIANEDARPKPSGKPPAWGNTRPEVCEALEWFKIREGFAHTQDIQLLGLLLDTEDGFDAVMTSELVITTVGGGRGTMDNGKKGQMKDQDLTDAKYRAFKTAMENGTPIPCIIGNRNVLISTAPQTKYAVADYFWCTNLWIEKSNGYNCAKVRLQKVDLATKSWWAPADEPNPPEIRGYSKKATYKACNVCKTTSPQVYKQAWICLEHTCASFWKINGAAIGSTELTYDPNFITAHTQFTGPAPQHKLVPDLPDQNVEPDYKVGLVCPKCRKCVARQYWDGWRCDNEEGCDFVHPISRETISAADAVKASQDKAAAAAAIKKAKSKRTMPTKDVDVSAQLEDVVDENLVETHVSEFNGHRVHTYTIPGIEGILFAHCWTTKEFNKAPRGPDELFTGMQEAKIWLRRNVMKHSTVPYTLTGHYAKNFGLPYDYVVASESDGFTDAPWPVLETLRHLTLVGKNVVANDDFQDFNEMLVVGYFEGSHMGFHDDGEETLGPCVTSLTLGNACWMSWRMKRKYYTGFTDGKCINYDPNVIVLPGCNDPGKRKEFNSRVRAEGLGKDEIKEQAKAAFNPQGRKKIEPPVMLKMRLSHGDAMAMDGTDLQLYFEHEVDFVDGMRFGMTCRHIKKEMLDEDQHWKGEFPEGFLTGEEA